MKCYVFHFKEVRKINQKEHQKTYTRYNNKTGRHWFGGKERTRYSHKNRKSTEKGLSGHVLFTIRLVFHVYLFLRQQEFSDIISTQDGYKHRDEDLALNWPITNHWVMTTHFFHLFAVIDSNYDENTTAPKNVDNSENDGFAVFSPQYWKLVVSNFHKIKTGKETA